MDAAGDNELISRMQAGSMEALGRLFDEHHARIHAYFVRMTGSRDDADDLVQEVFLRLYRYGSRYNSRSRFSAWLWRIAHNVCMDHFNASSKRQADREEMTRQAGSGRTDGSPHHDHRIELVRRALARINPDHRTVLLLSRFHHMRYAEIAEVLRDTEGAVKVRVHRAIKELREVYESLERGHE